MHVAQPPETLAAVRAALDAFDDPVGARRAQRDDDADRLGRCWRSRSRRGRLSPAEAWRAAHVDEDFQIERWGVDAEARARRDARWREMEAAALGGANDARPCR